MATTLIDRVPVDRITAEARNIHAGRTLLTLVAAVLFAVGWITAKVFTVAWVAIAWGMAAVKVGWQDARKTGGG